ncbi:MAG: hypothetical protein AAGD06_32825, partial [Acidobacteriota bacterium]
TPGKVLSKSFGYALLLAAFVTLLFSLGAHFLAPSLGGFTQQPPTVWEILVLVVTWAVGFAVFLLFGMGRLVEAARQEGARAALDEKPED